MQRESTIVGLRTKQQIQELLKFSKQVSNRCLEFTQRFLALIENKKTQPQMQVKYEWLFSNIFAYKKVVTLSGVCGRILTAKSYAFKCLMCQNEDNSIICIQCFNKSDHRGHPYQKIEVYGGCCDCGDDEKWKVEGSCSDHNKKITDVEVDAVQTELFIKEMQYVLYLVFVFTFYPIENHKSHIGKLLTGYAKFLVKFNEQSVISNEMSFQLFKSQFRNYPKVTHEGASYSLKIGVLSYLFRFYDEATFARTIVDLFISMFTRFPFRKYLTIEFNKAIFKKPLLIKSELSSISCQIYTSHKVISELIDTKQFAPIRLCDEIEGNFEIITDLYSRFYLDLCYLSNLYNNVGEKYMNFHFMNGNVADISGYERYVRDDPDFAIQYYGIEYILCLRYIEFLKHMQSNKNTLKKAILDMVAYFIDADNDQTMSLYISRERTLILLLFIYFDGDITKAATPQFLQEINLSYREVYRILQAVLGVIRFYALNLANRQTVERYYTFFSFSLNKRSRILNSLDFQLFKFCLLALQRLNPEVSLNFELDKHHAYYEMNQTFRQNASPIKELLKQPIQIAFNVIQQIPGDRNEEMAYDRRKALGYFTDYIGLLHEIIISNNSRLCLMVAYKLGKPEEFQKELIQFYGSLLKNFQSIKFEEFREICNVFLHNEEIVLQKFVKEWCVLQNKKIRLKTQRQDEFQSYNFSYLKSKKCFDLLNSYLIQNEKRNSIPNMPAHLKDSLVNQALKDILFPKSFIQEILHLTRAYLQMLNKYPEIVEVDLPHFIQYVRELLKLRYSLNSQLLTEGLQAIISNFEIFKKLPQNVQGEMIKVIGREDSLASVKQREGVSSKEANEKKMKIQQLKAKKLEKMRSKQLKALESFNEDKHEMKEEKDEQKQFVCMFCKDEISTEKLSILCFKQKSNIFARGYLGCKRTINMITTCNHFTHKSCNRAINNQRVYIYCNFCKTSSNQLLSIDEESELIEKMEEKTRPLGSSQLRMKERIIIQKSFNNLVTENMENEKEKKSLSITLSEDEEKIEYIASSILYAVVADLEFFTRSLSKVCCFILRDLAHKNISIQNLIHSIDTQIQRSKLSQTTAQNWIAYKFTILSVASMLAVERQNIVESWDIRQLGNALPPAFVEAISTILSSIKCLQSLKILQELKMDPYNPIQIRKLPVGLNELEGEMGSCPNCSRVTNEIAVCLLCPFKSCVGCQCRNLTRHAKQQHGNSTIYLRVDEGWLIYVSDNKNRMMGAIYLNYLGEQFSLQKSKKLDRSQYKLDKAAYNKAKNDLIRHRVEQEIRYAELVTSKFSELNP